MAGHSMSASPVTVSAQRTQDDHRLMSPPPYLPSAGHSGKERRQPSITPRKFRRFFKPRTRVSTHPSAARRALRDLTSRAINRHHKESSTPDSVEDSLVDVSDVSYNSVLDSLPSPQSAKRRKIGHHTPETSPSKPPASTPLTQATTPEPLSRMAAASTLLSPLASSPAAVADEFMSEAGDLDGAAFEPESPRYLRPLPRIAPLARYGAGGQLLQRQLGTMPRPGHQLLRCPVSDWRIETADFCSTRHDVHQCASHETPTGRCIPFCTASCNTNGLVAVGDEEGRVRLLDSDMPSHNGFGKIHVSFAAHCNAVIDLAFSEDDRFLATASGDQTGKVIDMMTQTPISILDHHTASLKQIRFQPGRGEGNVLATSGRDGSVKIWDLRCKGGPAQEITVERATRLHYSLPRKVSQGCVVNSIYDAHAPTIRQSRHIAQSAVTPDILARWEVPGRNGEVSVTAIQFLPPGKEHLILSACEADTSIKLWDIRNVHTSRQKAAMPISATSPPTSHLQWRPFGISSMSLSTDGARLYALCKDNTVYAYSTAHLALGHTPELSSRRDPPKRRNGTVQEGLGPIYGFRHEKLHATSFYVKTAVRPARHGHSELLAVGSSDGCAILFPTDERYFTDPNSHMLLGSSRGCGMEQRQALTPTCLGAQGLRPRQLPQDDRISSHDVASGPRRPRLFHTNSNSSLSGRLADPIPVVRNGTALVRGHEKKEVGPVCWTPQGNLVSVGDDYLVRCWREDRSQATGLRTGGEGEGRRWASGWADVGHDWDDEECCDTGNEDEW